MIGPRFFLLLLAFAAGLSPIFAQPADAGGRSAFEIEDGGAKRHFELALNETDEKQADGKSKNVPVTGLPATLKDMQQKARAAEAASGRQHDIVLYEQGKPRDVSSRRVLTRKVLLRIGPGFDEKIALQQSGAVKVERPAYAPGMLIITVKGAGDAILRAEELRQQPGVLSAEPLLARQMSKRLIPNDTFFSYNGSNPSYQWHLRNTGQSPGVAGVDVNVTTVWDTYLGDGVRIGIVDDGLEVATQTSRPTPTPRMIMIGTMARRTTPREIRRPTPTAPRAPVWRARAGTTAPACLVPRRAPRSWACASSRAM